MDRKLLLYSGGIKSTVMLNYLSKTEPKDKVTVFTWDCGQPRNEFWNATHLASEYEFHRTTGRVAGGTNGCFPGYTPLYIPMTAMRANRVYSANVIYTIENPDIISANNGYIYRMGYNCSVYNMVDYHMSWKEEVAKLGSKLCDTWSCEKNFDQHCGVCNKCQRRKAFFKENKILDKTIYRSR